MQLSDGAIQLAPCQPSKQCPLLLPMLECAVHLCSYVQVFVPTDYNLHKQTYPLPLQVQAFFPLVSSAQMYMSAVWYEERTLRGGKQS